MTRLFAPATPDSLLHRDAVSVLNLLLHAVAMVLLVVPFGRSESSQSILDRMVIFLVPPDAPGGRQLEPGTLDLGAQVGETGRDEGLTREDTDAYLLAARGDTPTLSAADLESARYRPEPEESALTALEVDSAVVRDPTSAAPEYPLHLLEKGIQGAAEVRYVVDTLGRVDTLSYRVVRATHPDFAVAVRQVLPKMGFRPALRSGQRVRQLVEQTFRFRIADTALLTPRLPDSLPKPAVPLPPPPPSA
jgi:TonB family protein